jgi:hypothetical protein
MSKYTDEQRLDCLERLLKPTMTISLCNQPRGGTFVEIEDAEGGWGHPSVVGATLRGAIDELLYHEFEAKDRPGSRP